MPTEPPSTVPPWRSEPFRLFFPLGMLIGCYGVGHWTLYQLGLIGEYSCLLHGMVQTQAFVIALALGFLLTAIPRRTQSPPATSAEIAALVVALLAVVIFATLDRWVAAEVAYATMLVLLLRFAVRRFVGGQGLRRPPAAFVLLPIGLVHGFVGAALLAAYFGDLTAAASVLVLGRLCVEQGILLCFTIGAGNLVLPLMNGAPPPADLGSSPRETRRAVAFAGAGLLLFASFVGEATGAAFVAPIGRAAVVAVALIGGAGAWRRPARPGLHRRLAWVSVWLMPIGLLASALLPDYRVPALHILFIGGFSLLGFAVATHVALSHAGHTELLAGRPWPLVAAAVCLMIAMIGRLTADWAATYFEHLSASAGFWIAAALLWLGFVVPKLRPGGTPPPGSIDLPASTSPPTREP